MAIRVAVIDDHPVFLRGLAQLIAASPEFELAGIARSLEDFQLQHRSEPEVVVLELRLPGVNGAVAVQRLRD